MVPDRDQDPFNNKKFISCSVSMVSSTMKNYNIIKSETSCTNKINRHILSAARLSDEDCSRQALFSTVDLRYVNHYGCLVDMIDRRHYSANICNRIAQRAQFFLFVRLDIPWKQFHRALN